MTSRRNRRALTLALLVLAACEPGRAGGPVARVGDWTLSVERLADLLVLGQPLPLDSVTVAALVDQWVSMAALAQREAAGADLMGEDARDASLWLERRQALLDAERRARLGAAAHVTRERAEAEFDADTLRLLAHVLRRAGPGTSPAERELQRRTAEGILADLRAGGSWSRAVAQSEDAETRAASGLLGLFRPEEVRAPLRAAAAGLRPGQVSSVVGTSLGFHVLYRPRWEDVADLYTELLGERLARGADSVASLDLLEARQVRVAPEAEDAVRRMAEGRTRATEPGATPLASWDGGALEDAVAARYLAALPDEARRRIAGAGDDAVEDFVRQLAVREIRLGDAERAGIEPDAEALEGLARMHREDVGRLDAALEGTGAAPSSPEAVDRYMERVVARQVAFEPLPPLLRAWLLAPLDWSVDRGAVDAATAEARRLLATTGSAGDGEGRR